jgi:hypothetical protein
MSGLVVVSAGESGRFFLHEGNALLMGSLPSEEDSRVMEAINSACSICLLLLLIELVMNVVDKWMIRWWCLRGSWGACFSTMEMPR